MSLDRWLKGKKKTSEQGDKKERNYSIHELEDILKKRPDWAGGHEKLARMYILGEDDIINMFKHFYIAAQLDYSLNQPHKYLREVYNGMGRHVDFIREDKADKTTDYFGGTVLDQGLCKHVRKLAQKRKTELERVFEELVLKHGTPHGPHGWIRVGRSFDELATSPRVEDIAKSNCAPGNFFVCLHKGKPCAAAVIDRIQDEYVPVIKRAIKACILRGEFFPMSEYPLVHLGLGIPIKFIGEKVNLSIVENLANFAEANFQDWVAAIETKQYTELHVYGPNHTHVASGRLDLHQKIISDIINVVNKANSFHKKIPIEKRNYKTAATKFFQQNPEPFIWSSK